VSAAFVIFNPAIDSFSRNSQQFGGVFDCQLHLLLMSEIKSEFRTILDVISSHSILVKPRGDSRVGQSRGAHLNF